MSVRPAPWLRGFVCLAGLMGCVRCFALSDDQLQRGQEALVRLNLYRAMSGLAPVTLDPVKSDGCVAHANYLAQNFDQIQAGLDAHDEKPDRPGYTEAGAKAGKDGDICYPYGNNKPSKGATAIDVWYELYYHRNPMLSPGVTSIGYGDNDGIAGKISSIAVLQFQTFSGGINCFAPADKSEGAATSPLTGEVPAPRPGFGTGNGIPLIAYFNNTDPKVEWVSSTVMAKGQTLTHSVVAPNKPVNPGFENNEICLIPDVPLPTNEVVFVSINFNQGGAPKTVNWSFRTSSTGLFDAAAAQASLGGGGTTTPPVNTGGGGTTVGSGAVVGSGADSDGDGFSDAFEAIASTDAKSAASSPSGAAVTAGALLPLTVDKASIKLNFVKANSDSITFSGSVEVPAGFDVSSAKFYCDVGGAAASLSTGKAAGGGTIKIKVKATKGVVEKQTNKYSVSLKGALAASLAAKGLTSADAANVSISVPFTLVAGTMVLQTQRAMVYSTKKQKTGAAK